ncbi:MAG: hypothetical protein AB1597_01935 [Chloroflexota bacterium]
MAKTTRAVTRKATFNLRPETLSALDTAMAQGAAPSKNAFVERALKRELDELARLARKARWEEGARDPRLLKDITDTDAAFRSADAETARRIA